jgi:diaminohydroxyphosphoribosylaminopyrimidine deaminase/5-amino-6-(5-phosphoribosylamino)uracil reductase
LTVRAVETSRQPLRVVIDRHAETPAAARVLAHGHALVVTAGARNDGWPTGVETLALPDAAGRIDLPALMRELARRGVNELTSKAGAAQWRADRGGLVDEVLHYVAPSVLATLRAACSSWQRRCPRWTNASARLGVGRPRRYGLRLIARIRRS